MYNAKIPADVTLPSSKQLLKSTVIAAITAAVLLVGIVMPSEYGIDPIGTGKLLGLKEMGEIKTQLAKEAAADREQATTTTKQTQTVKLATEPTVTSASARKDSMSVTLAPDEGVELKMPMQEGAVVNYRFTVNNGNVNYDLHGDGGGQSTSYKKGRGVANDEGQFEAEFTGNHGWFFRNRGTTPITITLETQGDYKELKKV